MSASCFEANEFRLLLFLSCSSNDILRSLRNHPELVATSYSYWRHSPTVRIAFWYISLVFHPWIFCEAGMVAMTAPPCPTLFHTIARGTERETAGPVMVCCYQQLLSLLMPLAACSSRLGIVGVSSRCCLAVLLLFKMP